MSEINCDCGYNYTQTGCPNCKHIPIDCTEKYEQALANMQREYDKRGERIVELEAKLLGQAFAVPEIKALVDALKAFSAYDRSAFLGPDAEKHKRAVYRGVKRKITKALAAMGVKP